MSTMWLLREVSIDWTINLTGDDHTIKLPEENLRSLMCDCTSSPCWQIIKLSDLNSLPSTPSIFLSMHSQAMIQIIIYCCPTALKCSSHLYMPPPPITNIFINHPPNHCHISIDHLKSIPHLYMPPPLLPHLYIPPSLHLHLAIISCPPLPPITNTSLFAIAKAFISNYF